MYPKLIIDLNKLKSNLDAVAEITKKQGKCSIMIVTKGLCADEQMVKVVTEHDAVDFMADSRIKNIASYAQSARAKGKKTVLLRLPMQCEIEEVVKYADMSFNSEISTIQLLNEEAAKQGVIHKILLMIDLGDLREGIFYQNEELIFKTVETVLKLKNIELYGLGVNLTCYGAIIPKKDNLSLLTALAEKLEKTYDLSLNMISGGNSSSIYLIGAGEMPEGINNLRLGEAFLLGNETAYGGKLSGTTDETLTLEAQIIELLEKPSLPIGEVGVDAFGQKPYYEDRGIIKRAIIGIGKQDTDVESMTPLDEKVDILGASSDHMILDVTNSDIEYKVGDILTFRLGYGGMLKTATSPYVEKGYK